MAEDIPGERKRGNAGAAAIMKSVVFGKVLSIQLRGR